MTLRLSMQDQERLRRWSAPFMGIKANNMADDMILIGIMSGSDVVAAVGFNAFYADQANIHVASNGSRAWLNKHILRGIANYAFARRNRQRLNAILPVWNRDAQILALKVGGVPEGYMRKAAGDGSDAVLIGILRENCPYLLSTRGGRHEQIST